MKKGSVELGADEKEGESESKIMNHIFGHLQHPKNKVRYLENIFFQTLEAFFTHKGVFFTKVTKANIIAFLKTKVLRNTPIKNVSP